MTGALSGDPSPRPRPSQRSEGAPEAGGRPDSVQLRRDSQWVEVRAKNALCKRLLARAGASVAGGLQPSPCADSEVQEGGESIAALTALLQLQPAPRTAEASERGPASGSRGAVADVLMELERQCGEAQGLRDELRVAMVANLRTCALMLEQGGSLARDLGQRAPDHEGPGASGRLPGDAPAGLGLDKATPPAITSPASLEALLAREMAPADDTSQEPSTDLLEEITKTDSSVALQVQPSPQEVEAQPIVKPIAEVKAEGGLTAPLLPKTQEPEVAISKSSCRRGMPRCIPLMVAVVASALMAVSAFNGFVFASAPAAGMKHFRGAKAGGADARDAGKHAGQKRTATSAEKEEEQKEHANRVVGGHSAESDDARQKKKRKPIAQRGMPSTGVASGLGAKKRIVGGDSAESGDARQKKKRKPIAQRDMPSTRVASGLGAKHTGAGKGPQPMSPAQEERELTVFEAKVIEEGLTCKHLTCSEGYCDQKGCVKPTCDGGHCIQATTFEASCKGGGCTQSSSAYAQCEGGSCV